MLYRVSPCWTVYEKPAGGGVGVGEGLGVGVAVELGGERDDD